MEEGKNEDSEDDHAGDIPNKRPLRPKKSKPDITFNYKNAAPLNDMSDNEVIHPRCRDDVEALFLQMSAEIIE